MAELLWQFFDTSVKCAWPLVVLIVIGLFRRQIVGLLPDLGQRLEQAEAFGSKFRFSPAAKMAGMVVEDQPGPVSDATTAEVIERLSPIVCRYLFEVANRPLSQAGHGVGASSKTSVSPSRKLSMVCASSTNSHSG